MFRTMMRDFHQIDMFKYFIINIRHIDFIKISSHKNSNTVHR